MSRTEETNSQRRDAYLIVKRELFYLPNAQGYTGIKDLAGRYTLAEVASMFPNLDSPNQDGMYFVHEDDAPEFSKACYDDLKVDHLQKKVNRLTTALVAADELAVQAHNWLHNTGQTWDGSLSSALAAYRKAAK